MMEEKETIERFVQGLQLAASRARELGVAQKNNAWVQIANSLDGIRTKGVAFHRATALTRQQTLRMIDDRVGKQVELEN
jgi:hypothetical protein